MSMSMSMYMSNSAPLHDFSIQLSLLKAPGVEPDSQGLARVELAAVAKGLPQKPVRRREDTSEDTSTELFQPVKLSIYASTDHQLGGDDLLVEQRFVTLPFWF
jgi:hypothetical protein